MKRRIFDFALLAVAAGMILWSLAARGDPLLGVIWVSDGGCANNLSTSDAGWAGGNGEFIVGEQTKVTFQCDSEAYICSPASQRSCDAGVGMYVTGRTFLPTKTGALESAPRAALSDGGTAFVKSAFISVCTISTPTNACKVWLGQGE